MVLITLIDHNRILFTYPVKHFHFSARYAFLNLVNIHNGSIRVTHITKSITNADHHVQ